MNAGSCLIIAGIVMAAGGTALYGWRLTFVDLAADVVITAGEFVSRYWLNSGVMAAVTAWVAWRLWRKRKNRKRALDALGAKSRALRDALVRKARDAARPRPVLRPVPGGAR